jgi:hypothetical protein
VLQRRVQAPLSAVLHLMLRRRNCRFLESFAIGAHRLQRARERPAGPPAHFAFAFFRDCSLDALSRREHSLRGEAQLLIVVDGGSASAADA